ncbi:MAG: hypothetical protein WCG01_04600 [bacterium]
MKNIIYGFYGATAALLLSLFVLVAFISSGPAPKVMRTKAPIKVSFEQRFNKLGAGAFGQLKAGQAINPVAKNNTLTGGGAELSSSAVRVSEGMVAGNKVAAIAPLADAKMIAPPYNFKTYKFVYKGGEIKLPGEQAPVYKRIKPIMTNFDTSGLVSQLNLGFVDMNTFSNQQLQNLNFVQRDDFGYTTSVMLDEGIVSIYQNWETWPAGKCGSDAKCYEAMRVQLSDMPSEETVLAIANEFVTSHKIDTSTYGPPEINNEWRRLYDATAVKDNYYFPDSIEVIYPSLIDGKTVYDEYNGTKTGLSIMVQIKDRKVNSVSNLMTQSFDTSDYVMETDAKKIIAYAEKGGNGGMIYAQTENITDLELSDPELILTKVYIYKDNRNEELYVPALYFSISNMPKDANYYRKAVIVPLAKDILAERETIATPGIAEPALFNSKTVK